MKAEVLAVGTELLMGQIANTNAEYISKNLQRVGIGVYYHSVVGDNPKRLKESIELSLRRNDIVIITGGLGPTQDDITKETVAEALGLKMVMDEKSVEDIKEYFSRRNTQVVESNYRQAYFPEGSIILRNFTGTAPGCILERNNKIIVMLPGPPKEMVPMFEQYVLPYFREKSEDLIESRFVNVVGIGESKLEEMLMPLIDNQTNPTYATYAKEGEVTIRVTVSVPKKEANHEQVAARMLDDVLGRVREILGDNIYSEENESLEEVVYRLCMENNKTFALAESVTGGMVASRMTKVPGVSEIFHMGVVSYSNEAKMKLLGVSSETLSKYGAVSSECAIEMAEGVRKLSGADIGVSITGIAGPGGGTEKNPVGNVFIGIATEEKADCKEFYFSGNRERIRRTACTYALDLLRRYAIK